MGEAGLTEGDLDIIKMTRAGEQYYFISSKQNTIEIRISDGKVSKINGKDM